MRGSTDKSPPVGVRRRYYVIRRAFIYLGMHMRRFRPTCGAVFFFDCCKTSFMFRKRLALYGKRCFRCAVIPEPDPRASAGWRQGDRLAYCADKGMRRITTPDEGVFDRFGRPAGRAGSSGGFGRTGRLYADHSGGMGSGQLL